ncbi:MAG: hypothetical protein ABWY11_13065 [Umezawaea sp.]
MSGWVDDLCALALAHIEEDRRPATRGDDGVEVTYFRFAESCPPEVEQHLRHLAITEPPTGLAALLEEDGASPEVEQFREYLRHPDVGGDRLLLPHALCHHLAQGDGGQAAAAFALLGQESSGIAGALLLRCTVPARLVAVLSNHGAGRDLDLTGLQASLDSLPQGDLLRIIVQEDADALGLGESDVDDVVELADWVSSGFDGDVPAAIAAELLAVAYQEVDPLFIAWTSEWKAFRDWASSWFPSGSPENLESKARGLRGDAYDRRLRKEAKEVSEKRIRAKDEARGRGARRFRNTVVTDHDGRKRVVNRTPLDRGESDVDLFEDLVLDARAVRRKSRDTLKSAHDGAVMEFYQLRELVLVPGNDGLADLQQLDWIREVGKRGVLRVRKSRALGDPGRVEQWGAHDPDLFARALGKFTDKEVVAGTGGEPEVTFGVDVPKERERLRAAGGL